MNASEVIADDPRERLVLVGVTLLNPCASQINEYRDNQHSCVSLFLSHPFTMPAALTSEICSFVDEPKSNR